MPFFLTLGLGLLVLLWLTGEPLWVRWRRRRLWVRPFPERFREILRRRLPYFQLMPADLQLQLKRRIQVFLAEKRFVGCSGLVITDEIRVTIAAQACLLLLNRRSDFYPYLRQILVYPHAFVVDRLQNDGVGVLQESRQVLAGESWSQGQVILSWTETIDGAADAHDGRNVVIHEFAHQLDQEFGQANGAPVLNRREDYARWSEVLGEEFARLQYQAAHQQPALFSYYGATNPAEFFAVVSEVFFEQPQPLHSQHPALYRELAAFYRVDPLSWA